MPLPAIPALMRVIASAIGTALLTRTMPSSLSAHAAEAAAKSRHSSSSSGMPKFAKRLAKRPVMERLLLMCQCSLHGFRNRMIAQVNDMKCELALNLIAAGYRTDWVTAFQTPCEPASDGARPIGGPPCRRPDQKIVSSRMPEQDMSPSPANAERLK